METNNNLDGNKGIEFFFMFLFIIFVVGSSIGYLITSPNDNQHRHQNLNIDNRHLSSDKSQEEGHFYYNETFEQYNAAIYANPVKFEQPDDKKQYLQNIINKKIKFAADFVYSTSEQLKIDSYNPNSLTNSFYNNIEIIANSFSNEVFECPELLNSISIVYKSNLKNYKFNFSEKSFALLKIQHQSSLYLYDYTHDNWGKLQNRVLMNRLIYYLQFFWVGFRDLFKTTKINNDVFQAWKESNNTSSAVLALSRFYNVAKGLQILVLYFFLKEPVIESEYYDLYTIDRIADYIKKLEVNISLIRKIIRELYQIDELLESDDNDYKFNENSVIEKLDLMNALFSELFELIN